MKIGSGNITSTTTHMRVVPEIEALQTEIINHPELKAQLIYPGAVKNFEDGLAIIATYVDVILDGIYQADEIAEMAQMLVNKLIEKRTGIVGIIT